MWYEIKALSRRKRKITAFFCENFDKSWERESHSIVLMRVSRYDMYCRVMLDVSGENSSFVFAYTYKSAVFRQGCWDVDTRCFFVKSAPSDYVDDTYTHTCARAHTRTHTYTQTHAHARTRVHTQKEAIHNSITLNQETIKSMITSDVVSSNNNKYH